MRSLIVFIISGLMAISGCKKGKHNGPECTVLAIVPYQPYFDPIWHPNGNLLGFNHTPQAGVFSNGAPPCIWYMNSLKQDSAGLYLMNKDGTGFRRVTNFYLNTPSWSPDGNWIAFSIPPHIYKMKFNGYSFDTANIIQLTTTGANFFPSWTENSDTIFFDSNNDAPTGTNFYSIWKMASDGNGKIRLTQSAGIGDSRQPSVGSSNRIYFMSYASGKQEIFSMDKNGSDIIQESTNSGGGSTPKFWQNKIFFESGGIKVAANGIISLLASPAVTYDISMNGEIIYGKWDYSVNINERQKGTLWIMNADGSNNRQLTFNNF